MLICPEASNAQNSMAAVSADGSTVWVLILRLNSSCNRRVKTQTVLPSADTPAMLFWALLASGQISMRTRLGRAIARKCTPGREPAENGFCVVRIKARGHRELVTLVGHAATISAGEWVTATGNWVNDRTHGQQFKARFLKTSAPTSAEGIEKYLASGMIRGVGLVYCRAIRG